MLNWVQIFEILVQMGEDIVVFSMHGYHEKHNLSVDMGGFGKAGRHV